MSKRRSDTHLNFDDNPVTLFQLNGIHETVVDIIENMDDISINTLFSGNSNDVDGIMSVFFDETYKAMFTVGSKAVVQSSFDYLDRVTDQFDSALRRLSLAYFTSSTLVNFELAPHILEWMNLIQIYQFLGITAARGHSKSYTFSFAQILWKMYRYGEMFAGSKNLEMQMSKEGMLITNEISLAGHLLSMVKEEVEENPFLREVLYPNTRENWGNSFLKAKNGSSVIAKSYGSKMRGHHPTYIVVDDFLSDNVLYSKTQKQKYNDALDTVIVNMLKKTGQITAVGTPFVVGDLYDHIREMEGWAYFEYPALFPNGDILWETEHTFDSLMKLRKKIGSVNFSRELLVRHITEASSVFTWDLIRRSFVGMDKITLVDSLRSHPLSKDFDHIVMGCDFALSSTASADFTVFVVIGVHVSGKYYLLHLFKGKGLPYSQQVARAKAIHDNFEVDLTVVETNGAQKIFADMMSERDMNVMEHHTGTEKNTFTEGIPAIAVLFGNDRVRLPRGDSHSRDVSDTIGLQFNSFSYDDEKGKLLFISEHDDDAMSFWQACRGARYLETGRLTFSFV